MIAWSLVILLPSPMPAFSDRGLFYGLLVAGFFLSSASAQRIAPRGKLPRTAVGPLTLSVRDAVSTTIVTENRTSYVAIPGESGSWKVQSNTAERKQEWSIDGKVIPVPEGAPAPTPVVEKKVKFTSHGGRLFLKVEILARPGENDSDGTGANKAGKEVHFSGTYEANLVEGTWPPEKSEVAGNPERVTRVRLAPSEQSRYSSELQQAFFSEEMLKHQADHYRESMIDLIQRKIASPDGTSAGEIALARQLLGIVRAHPEAFVVEVTPEFECSPEMFLFDASGLHSTTERESWTLRFSAHLPAIAPPGSGR